MFTIRDQQLVDLLQSRENAFVARAVPLLRQAWPEQLANRSDADVDVLLRYAIRVAASYGITEGKYVLSVATILVLCGPGFEQRSDCARIVTELRRRKQPLQSRFRLTDALLACHVGA